MKLFKYRLTTIIVSLSIIALTINATEYEYPNEYADFSKKTSSPVGVSILAFNRPEYFKMTIRSLETNEESKTMPFFFFLDGGENSTMNEHIEIINKSKLVNKHIICRETNYGIPKNDIDSKRFLFEWCQFEQIISLQEDIIVSKNYLKSILNLYKWAKNTYSNIGSVQMWIDTKLTSSEKTKKLRFVRETQPYFQFLTFCMDRESWAACSPVLYEYEKRFFDPLLGIPEYDLARSKPSYGKYSQQIAQWIHDLINEKEKFIEIQHSNNFLPPKVNIKDIILNLIQKSKFEGNEDEIYAIAMWLADLIRLQTIVNRVAHIGEHGIERIHPITTVLDELPEKEEIKMFVFQ